LFASTTQVREWKDLGFVALVGLIAAGMNESRAAS